MEAKTQSSEDDEGLLLAVDLTYLNPATELKKVFGSRALRNNEDDRSGSGNRGVRNRTANKREKIAKKLRQTVKTRICSPQDTWPIWVKTGLAMEMERGSDGKSA